VPIRGDAIRPTSDRVREAVFNIIAPAVSGAQVVDLFAGTGAMGIEALSRGARRAVFIDNRKTSVAAVRKNIDHLGLGQRSQVILWDIAKNLNCLKIRPSSIALVFVDPPYRQNLVGPALFHLDDACALAPGATIVVEHAAADPLPAVPERYVLTDQRKYGKTFVSFLNYAMNALTS